MIEYANKYSIFCDIVFAGATNTVAVGPHSRAFLPSILGKGAMPMIELSDLIQLLIYSTALAGLFYSIGKRK